MDEPDIVDQLRDYGWYAIGELDPYEEERRDCMIAAAEEIERLRGVVNTLLNGTPSQMSSPDGLLPINSTGMRHAIDRWVELRAVLERTGHAAECDDYECICHLCDKQYCPCGDRNNAAATTALDRQNLEDHLAGRVMMLRRNMPDMGGPSMADKRWAKELADEVYYVQHGHRDRCCKECGSHSMPHRGCILR